MGVGADKHLTFKKYFSHKIYLLTKVRPMLNEKVSIDIVKVM